MYKNNNYKIVFIIILVISLASCENNVEENNMVEIELCDPNVSFINDVKPIIDNSCISCHSGNQFPDLTSYASIKNNANIIKAQVEARTMPIGGTLTNAEIKLISCWIDNGKPNN
jgi:uncharacterized membrane protein